MSEVEANIVGLIGSALFIGGFAYANVTKELNKLWFNIVNLLGAICLMISLSIKFNLAAFVLEAAWAMIALAGIVSAIRSRKAQP